MSSSMSEMRPNINNEDWKAFNDLDNDFFTRPEVKGIALRSDSICEMEKKIKSEKIKKGLYCNPFSHLH